MFIEFCPLSGNIVYIRQSHFTIFQGIVNDVSFTVGHIVICKCITCTPVYLVIIIYCVFPGELGVICHSAGIIILCTLLIITLSTYSYTSSISVSSKLVENILKLISAVTACSYICKVQHRSNSCIVIILIILTMS